MYKKNIITEYENMLFENRKIIKNIKFDYVVTLNTRELIHYPTFKNFLVYEFERQLNKKLYGKDWRTKGTKIHWIHNYETKSNNTHSHSVCKLNGYIDVKKFKKQARHIWAKLNRSFGNLNSSLYIDTFSKPSAVAHYITKDNNADFSFV